MTKFKTNAAYISGGICGALWWPVDSMAGKTIKQNLRGPWGILDRFDGPVTFERALLSVLMDQGGDFQNAQFTADTVIHIERTSPISAGKYAVHVKEIELIKLVPDLVNADQFTGDFIPDDY